ncbi:MAG: hypothetical protein CMJ75_02065, partial [Planctomycetaceae bacterium]|nr:hypothetical protein [Planctomycetaceae bacterium]
QRPQDQRPQDQRPQDLDRRGRERDRRPPSLILQSLDTNRDGQLSPAEVAAATEKLQKLDRDGNGRLSADELAAPRDRRERDHARPDGRRRGPTEAEGPPRRPGREPDSRDSDNTGERFIQRLMAFDDNKDGQLSKEELPERMQRILERHDRDENGKLDRTELQNMAVEASRRSGRGGFGGRDRGRFGGGRGGFGGGRERGGFGGRPGGREGARGFGPPDEGRRAPRGFDAPEGGRGFGRPDEGRRGPGGRFGGGPPDPEQFVERALEFDANKDGKLDRDELRKLAEGMSQRFGPGGFGGRPSGRERGGFGGRVRGGFEGRENQGRGNARPRRPAPDGVTPAPSENNNEKRDAGTKNRQKTENQSDDT